MTGALAPALGTFAPEDAPRRTAPALHGDGRAALVIEASRVFTGREVLRNARVVIAGDTIAAVLPGVGRPGEVASATAAPGRTAQHLGGAAGRLGVRRAQQLGDDRCTTLRFPDATLLPGLIDAHVHLGLLARAELKSSHARPAGRAGDDAAGGLGDAAVRVAEAYLARGVTTLRDLGDRRRLNLTVRRRLAARSRPGPRVLVPGRALHRQGLYGGFIGAAAATIDELLDLAEAELAAGADFIKVIASGIIDFQRGAADAPLPFTAAELRALVDLVHDRGRKVAAHASGRDGVAAAVEAGADFIEHGFFAGESEIDAFARAEATWVPTFVPVQVVAAGAAAGAAGELDGAQLARIRSILDQHAAGVRRVVAAGGAVIAGSDAGSPGVWEAGGVVGELRCLYRAGVPATEVLAAATYRAARTFGIAHLVGSIEAGKRADLLVVGGDALQSPDALRDVRLVLRDGVAVRRLHGNDEPVPARMRHTVEPVEPVRVR